MNGGMAWPARCRHCGHVHDAARVEVVARYADCSTWRCPSCKALIDDRPPILGGCLTGPEVGRQRKREREWGFHE